MPDLFIPEGSEELAFHEAMLADHVTVRGITVLKETDPVLWKEDWGKESDDSAYRLIYCDGCGYFVGDVAWKRTGVTEAQLWLMILGDLREEGYGSSVLKQTAWNARQKGIRTFTILLPGSHPHRSFFEKRGFQVMEENDRLILRADTDVLSRCRCQENVCSLHADD